MSQILLRFPSSVKPDPAIERNGDAGALMQLIETAYADLRRRVKAEVARAGIR